MSKDHRLVCQTHQEGAGQELGEDPWATTPAVHGLSLSPSLAVTLRNVADPGGVKKIMHRGTEDSD